MKFLTARTALAATSLPLVAFAGYAVVRTAAAAPPPPPRTSDGATGKQRTITYVGDSYQARETPQGTVLTLSGNVRFGSDDSVLVTELAIYNKTTSIAESPGKLHLEDAKNAINGDHGIAYYKPREAKISGNVVITVKPKSQPATTPGTGTSASNSVRSEFDAPATISCSNLDYYWRSRVATITGGLTLRFKDYVVTADKATYFANDDRIDLEGNIKYTRSGRQDTGATSKATILITEGREELRVPTRVNGAAQVEDENGSDAAAPTPPPLPDIKGARPPAGANSPSSPAGTTGEPTPAVAPPATTPSASGASSPPPGATSPSH